MLKVKYIFYPFPVEKTPRKLRFSKGENLELNHRDCLKNFSVGLGYWKADSIHPDYSCNTVTQQVKMPRNFFSGIIVVSICSGLSMFCTAFTKHLFSFSYILFFTFTI